MDSLGGQNRQDSALIRTLAQQIVKNTTTWKGRDMSEQEALATIKKDIEGHDVFIYMKGTPESPMCGFSAQVIQVLKTYGVKFGSRNVLDDWDVREGIKKFANWPTIPQLYVKGKFVGGCDIVAEMHRKGQLAEVFKDLASHN